MHWSGPKALTTQRGCLALFQLSTKQYNLFSFDGYNPNKDYTLIGSLFSRMAFQRIEANHVQYQQETHDAELISL